MRAAVVESFFDATIFSNLGSSNSDTNKKVQRWKPENRNSRKLLSDKGIRKARKGRVGKGKEKEGRKKEGLEDQKNEAKRKIVLAVKKKKKSRLFFLPMPLEPKGPPRLEPLTSIEALLSWEPGSRPHDPYCRSSVPLRTAEGEGVSDVLKHEIEF